MAKVDVTWEDQNNINTFSKLNLKMHELQAMISRNKRLQEDLEDAENELMLADDEEVRYVIGECLVHFPSEEASERLLEAASKTRGELAEYEAELEGIKAEMAKLKVLLYGKFGSSINLDE